MGEPHLADEPTESTVPEGRVETGPRRRVSRPVSAGLLHRVPAPSAPSDEAAPPPDPPPESGGPAAREEYPPDLVFLVDHAGQVLYVNRPLGALAEDDIIGSEIYDWIFPEQHGLVRQCLEHVRATGRPVGCEIPGIQHHDADAWYELRVTPNLREDRIVSLTIIARDITRHKRAQQRMRTRLMEFERLAEERAADLEAARQALEERTREERTESDEQRSDRWFRALLDAAGEAIFVTDPATGEILDANETACRWLRRAREDVLGRTARDLGLEFPINFPEDADLQFTETRDTRRPLILPGGLHRRQDGSTFPVEVAVARHEIADREVVLAVGRDVKSRQQTEEALHDRTVRYQALFEHCRDAVYVTTRAGTVTEANPAAAALFGYAQGELSGLDARALIPAPDDIRRWQRTMAEQGIVTGLDVTFHRRDGSTFRGRLWAVRLRDREGGITGYQCLVQPTEVAAPSPEEHVAPREEPASAGGPPAVLLVEPLESRRAELAGMLAEAGYAVVAESEPGRAAEHFREPADRLAAVIVGLEGQGASGEWALRSIRALDADVPLVAVIGNGRAAEALGRLGEVGIAATLPAPVHPLALVQALREATAAT